MWDGASLLSFTADPEEAKVDKSDREGPPGMVRTIPAPSRLSWEVLQAGKPQCWVFRVSKYPKQYPCLESWGWGSIKGFLKGHVMVMEQQTAQNPIHWGKSRSNTNKN